MPKSLKTECKWGHPLSGDNLHIKPDGTRRCLTCHREQKRRYSRMKRAGEGKPVATRSAIAQDTKRLRKEAQRLSGEGMTQTAIAKKVGVTQARVSQLLIEARQPRPAPARRPAKVVLHLFWRGRHLGRVTEDMGDSVRYESRYGYEAKVPMVRGWVRLVPEAHIADLLPMYG